MSTECLIFKPLYMERVWGGRKLETLFARELPRETPIGESWELVDRKDAQSIVSEGRLKGSTLHELWTSHREEIFGTAYSQSRFPILIKILDASSALSIQVHPPVHLAPPFGEEPKTEMWYFAATEKGSSIYAGLKKGTSKREFEAALRDASVANLLHRIPSTPDDFIFIPSGRLHAIDAGNVIFEIQQNSDTTYRVFDWNRVGPDGVPRKLHLEESFRSIDFDDFEPTLSHPSGETLVASDYFTVDRWKFTKPRSANDLPQFSVFQVVRGKINFKSHRFRSGDLFLVPASIHNTPVIFETESSLVLRITLRTAAAE